MKFKHIFFFCLKFLNSLSVRYYPTFPFTKKYICFRQCNAGLEMMVKNSNISCNIKKRNKCFLFNLFLVSFHFLYLLYHFPTTFPVMGSYAIQNRFDVIHILLKVSKFPHLKSSDNGTILSLCKFN